MIYDVIIIGAGVTGSAIARELSRYQLSILVVDKAEDVCCGTSKANSGIVHSGIDCKPGTLKARMNILGNEKMEALSRELDFPFERNGSLILCFSEKKRPALNKLYEQGLANRVPGIRILEKEELHAIEQRVSDEAIAALYAPTGGIVCPFGMNIAMAENAARNGVAFQFDTEVTHIHKIPDGYALETDKGLLQTRCVVNAAGVYADKFHNMVSLHKICITPRIGEYCLLDKTAGGLVKHTIFQLPTKSGKGILVTPTVHGNILIGPTAKDCEDKESTDTTSDGLKKVMDSAQKSVPGLPLRQIITSFAGSRAHEEGGEFILGQPEDAPGFVDAAGIESPGLTSAPAIGSYIAEIVYGLLSPAVNPNFDGTRKGILDPKTLSPEARAELIRKQPAYGNIVCRCESVTEGEILDAIRRPLGAKSLDGVKRRVRAGMGRCQAGFCSPKVLELLAGQRQISPLEITKSGSGSTMTVSRTKTGLPIDTIANDRSFDGVSQNTTHTTSDDLLQRCDVVIIGGGPAGLAAAISARENGADSVLILERDSRLGGILNQCIHNGFGLHTFKEELTGPEYAHRFIRRAAELQIPYHLNTMVLHITKDKIITAVNRTDGILQIKARSIILAMGCRERSRGALNIPGSRPAGIYSAGCAQHLVNLEGYMPGKEVVILGSGDIGLIMARRMTLEGATVKVVAELMPYSGGLKRNIVQCLDDFGIPLKLRHTVVAIRGKKRLEGVTLAQVDTQGKPIPGTEEDYSCDTLLLSCGLIPENELSRGIGLDIDPATNGPCVNESLETSVTGIFACGNVLHVHDLVDYVSEEATVAGKNAARYVKQASDITPKFEGNGAELSPVQKPRDIPLLPADGVRYIVPKTLRMDRMEDTLKVRFRVGAIYKNCFVSVFLNDERILHRKKPIMAPGEMEEILLQKKQLEAVGNPETITIRITDS